MKKIIFMCILLVSFMASLSAQNLVVPTIVLQDGEGDQIHIVGSLHFGTSYYWDGVVTYADSVGTPILHLNMLNNYRFDLTYEMIAHLFGVQSERFALSNYYKTGNWLLCDLSVSRMNEILNSTDQDFQNDQLLSMVLDPDNRFLYQKMIIEEINQVRTGPVEMIVFYRALEVYKKAAQLKSCVIIASAAQISLLVDWLQQTGYSIISYEERMVLAGT